MGLQIPQAIWDTHQLGGQDTLEDDRTMLLMPVPGNPSNPKSAWLHKQCKLPSPGARA